MANVLTIEGKEYTPATDAGKHFGYTKDYLLMLIKNGKIEGRKIGHKWYVHVPTAAEFFKTSELVREARRKAISEARKTELKIHTRTRAKSHSHVALVETLAIVVIGLAIGATGYLGTVATPSAAIQGNYSFLEQLAVSVYRFVSPETSVVVHTNTQPKNPSLEATAVSAQIATTTYTSLVVAPDELFTATSVESIQESFSDPVTVSIDPENPQTGIITPIFKEGNGDAYRFLMVPVTTKAE